MQITRRLFSLFALTAPASAPMAAKQLAATSSGSTLGVLQTGRGAYPGIPMGGSFTDQTTHQVPYERPTIRSVIRHGIRMKRKNKLAEELHAISRRNIIYSDNRAIPINIAALRSVSDQHKIQMRINLPKQPFFDYTVDRNVLPLRSIKSEQVKWNMQNRYSEERKAYFHDLSRRQRNLFQAISDDITAFKNKFPRWTWPKTHLDDPLDHPPDHPPSWDMGEDTQAKGVANETGGAPLSLRYTLRNATEGAQSTVHKGGLGVSPRR